MYAFKHFKSPVGNLKLVAADTGLRAILWENDDPMRVRLGPLAEELNNPILLEAERQLTACFSGTLRAFTIDLSFSGTEFQQRVWHASTHHTIRRDSDLWRYSAPNRKAHSVSRSRCSKWQKPDLNHRTMPPRDRINWRDDRIRWRYREQRIPAQTRTGVIVSLLIRTVLAQRGKSWQ